MTFPKENRVRVSVYGSLSSDSPLLIPVPSVPGGAKQRLHVLAARGFETLANAVRFEIPEVGPLLVSSGSMGGGWRPPRFTSWTEYVQKMCARYGSVEKGRRFVAFESPHQTGLAVDFACGGLSPISSTIPQQRKTPLYKWLCENAHEYGWTPYNEEPWHWEFNIPLKDYWAGLARENDVCESVDGECSGL